LLKHVLICALAFVVSMQSAAQSGGKVVCFFGDSITEGWMDAHLHPELAFPGRVDSLLRARSIDATVYNLGRAGETTGDALRRVSSELLSLQPDVVIIAFGSNDMYIPGNASTPRVSLPFYRQNLSLLVRMIQAQGGSVILLGPPPIKESRFYRFVQPEPYLPYGGASALNRAYANGMRETAAVEHVSFVPVPFDTTVEDETVLGFDGQHPNPEGHLRIATALLPVIDSSIGVMPVPLPAASNISVYPQPAMRDRTANLVFVLPAEAGQEYRVDVFDASGRAIHSLRALATISSTAYLPWDLSTAEHRRVAPGMYLAHVVSTGMKKMLPIIVY
jgi:lysophospholipase L1-like esterase